MADQMYKELGHVGTARTASTSCSSVAEAFTPRKEYNSQISGVATPFTGFLDLVSLPKLSPFGTLDRAHEIAKLAQELEKQRETLFLVSPLGLGTTLTSSLFSTSPVATSEASPLAARLKGHDWGPCQYPGCSKSGCGLVQRRPGPLPYIVMCNAHGTDWSRSCECPKYSNKSPHSFMIKVVQDARKANVQVPSEVLQAAESAKKAWAAVKLVKGLSFDERFKLLKQLAQRGLFVVPAALQPAASEDFEAGVASDSEEVLPSPASSPVPYSSPSSSSGPQGRAVAPGISPGHCECNLNSPLRPANLGLTCTPKRKRELNSLSDPKASTSTNLSQEGQTLQQDPS